MLQKMCVYTYLLIITQILTVWVWRLRRGRAKKNADLKVGVVCGASLWTLDVLFELGVSSVLSRCDAGQAQHRRVTVF